MSTRVSIKLQGLRFHLPVGVLPHEATLPQPLEVDVTIRREPRDAASTPAVLDYRAVYDLVAAEVHRGPLGFLEEFGERVAAAAIALDGADHVRVAVRKPHVPLPGPLAYAEVVVERDRRA